MSQNKYTLDFLNACHKKCSSNKPEILASTYCACFCCEQIFEPQEINEWFFERDGSETAVCPRCDTDSVLSPDFPIDDPQFLREMSAYYFENDEDE